MSSKTESGSLVRTEVEFFHDCHFRQAPRRPPHKGGGYLGSDTPHEAGVKSQNTPSS